MERVGWLSLGFCAYFHQNVLLVQGKRWGPKMGFLLLWRVPWGLPFFAVCFKLHFSTFMVKTNEKPRKHDTLGSLW